MNERIEQLADQCMTERQDSNGVYVEYFDHKKFAELIIDEVLQVIAVSDSNCYNEWDFAERDIYVEIQKHFGVE